MDEENKKINLESFFNKIDSADKMASSALSKANSNLGIINNQKALIESLSVSIEAIQTKIRDIANYIIVEKKLERDLEEDRRLETEDAEQKRQMTERATAMGERGPQGEPGKPEPAQGGGGGGFLGGLIKLLVGGGVLAAALPTIGPMLLNQFVLPKIGEGLKFVFDKGMGWLSKNLGGVFNPATYAPLGIGKFFTGLKKGVESKFEGAKSAFGGFVSGFFKGDGGGAGSGSNMSLLGDMSSVKNMETTLKENDLVEEKPKNVEMEEYEEEANKLKEERDIAEETGETDISGELRKRASGGDEELSNVEVGRKFKVTKGKKEKTLEELESKYARLLAKIQKMKDEERNSEMIDYEEGKANDLKFVIDMKKKEMGLIEDKGIGKSLIEAGMGKGKSSYSATTEYKFVEPIKKETEELDLSLRQNIETNDKLVNAVSYQSGTENKDQNSSVLVQNKPAQVTIASIKKTSSTVPFIKANKNKFLSINETELPPQVARMLT
tara:strand:- start:149 stop:1639 length:1491 start_codon:yes stop_codon:yes gene_type:complete